MSFSRSYSKPLILNKFFLAWIVVGLGMLGFVTSMAAAGVDNTDNLLQLLGGIKTMQANFVQTTLGKGSAQTGQSANGTMALQRPGKFRWDVKQPQHQLIVANGNHVWVYDADLEQVTKQSLDANETGNPAQLLSGDNKALQETFYVTSLAATGGDSCFVLRPKNKNNMYHKVNLCFDGDKLSSMVMEDNLGQSSKFVFSNVVINANLSANLFVFTAPKGVDVIDNK